MSTCDIIMIVAMVLAGSTYAIFKDPRVRIAAGTLFIVFEIYVHWDLAWNTAPIGIVMEVLAVLILFNLYVWPNIKKLQPGNGRKE